MYARLSWAFAFAFTILITNTAYALPGLSSLDVIDLENDSIPLHKRQSDSSGVPIVPPAQCQSSCDSVTSVLSSDAGCKASVCCNADFEQNYFTCFQCVAKSANLTDLTGPQFLVDTLFNECALAGFSLPKLTFAGQNSSRVLSSVVSHSPTSTGVSGTGVSSLAPPGTSPISTLPLSILSPSHSLLTSSSLTVTGSATITSVSAPGSTNTSPVSGSSPSPTAAAGVRSLDSRLGVGVLAVVVGMILPQII